MPVRQIFGTSLDGCFWPTADYWQFSLADTRLSGCFPKAWQTVLDPLPTLVVSIKQRRVAEHCGHWCREATNDFTEVTVLSETVAFVREPHPVTPAPIYWAKAAAMCSFIFCSRTALVSCSPSS